MKQLTIFDVFGNKYKINNKIMLIEMFAGIGSQAMALRDLGIPFEHHRVFENDTYAISSYNSIHGTNFPTIDIKTVKGVDLGIEDKLAFTYLLTYSFPCTSLSIAGKMEGMEEGSGTSSSLLWEVKRILEECEKCNDGLPQILLMENVPQVHSKKNMPHFQKWLDFLNSKGYSTYWQDMNSRDYGIPQSRNRTIAISILGDYTYEFPAKKPLKVSVKDYLEENIDPKYYITNSTMKKLIDRLVIGGKITHQDELGASHYPHGWLKDMVDFSGTFPTIDAGIWKHHTFLVEKSFVGIKQNTKKGYIPCEIGGVVDLNYPTSQTRRGRVIDQGRVCPTLTTGSIPSVIEPWLWEIENVIYCIKARRLTSREAWRLMGFADEDYEKAKKVNSDTQLYKQAGNSIVKQVLMEVIGMMWDG